MHRLRHVTLALAGLLAAASTVSLAQSPQQPNVNGMRPTQLRAHAIVGATVVTAPGKIIENATIVIRDGIIEAVGVDIDIPADARRWPGESMTVYPGLIDAAVLVSVKPKNDDVGSHWNGRVHPELNMMDYPLLPASKREQYRSSGFTVAAVYPSDGIFRGTGSITALGSDDDDTSMYQQRAAMMMGFDYGGGWNSATYPGSHMGSIALIRQTFLDAQWHAACQRVYADNPQGNEPPAPADALDALGSVLDGSQSVLFEVGDELKAQRAARLAEEFNIDIMLLGSGTEFRRLQETIDLALPMIIPIEFPGRPSVSTLHEAQGTSLRELATWEQAPTNPRRLINAGATVALTTHKLKSPSKFHSALRSVIKHGLTEQQALASVTTVPAELLGLDHVIGTIAPGKLANLVVVEGSLFDDKSKIRDTWVNGQRYEISKDDEISLVGSGTLATSLGHELDARIDTTKSLFTIELPAEEAEGDDEPDAEADDAAADEAKKKPKPTKIKAKKVIAQRDQVSCVIDGKAFDAEGYVQLSGVIDGDEFTGSGRLPDRTPFFFRMQVAEEDNADGDDEKQLASADEQGVAASAVAGDWSVEFRGDQLPEAVNIVMTMESNDDAAVDVSITMMGEHMELGTGTFDAQTGELVVDTDTSPIGAMQLNATIDGDSITGNATSMQGLATFSGSRVRTTGDGVDEDDADHFEMPPDQLAVPLGAYGLTVVPQPEDVLIRGATIWTSGPEGVIEEGDLFINDGKVEYVGPTVSWAFEGDGRILEVGASPKPGQALRADEVRSPNAPRIINAHGMHITPGLIDCHSHTGIDGGVNEWTQVNTAEVRIGDVVDPDDINWYRQLAGGLTACNQLHGSANPIGGQNSVVKLKWGGTADDYRINDAIPGIKFALGENVKRSQSRYPNTRMGVETVIRDAFTAAREYEHRWQRYLDLSSEKRKRTMPPARDLELDALVEILNGERLVHCHSYRQDEILMLIHVADEFGFTIGTFQHVLEGYKVAEAIAEHGAGASSFSDWWAYKVEVMDAIPYNGALMTDVGVNVSFNSDSSELARRMNGEAAKAVRYGGMEPHEALKFVTINPAKQLRIDHRTGSLEQGKDADFVIWSGDPLSTYSVCQQTWIEGACYYDQQHNLELQHVADAEHQRLIQKVLAAAHGAATSSQDKDDAPAEADTPDITPTGVVAARVDAAVQWMLEQVRAGVDPEHLHPGDCGCNDMLRQLMQSEVQR